jgi:hypothetical protein
MIVTKIQGGLGNQLFQWAVTRNLSITHNTEYYFDLNQIGKSFPDVSSRGLELDKFKKLIINHQSYTPNLNRITDNYIFKEIGDNTYLDGYWQSEKYFKENENIIRRELEIPDDVKSYLNEKYPFLTENTISIHVRRGDYVRLSNYHPIQSVKYYEDSYDIINDKNVNVAIFSDDIEWCEKHLIFDNIHYIKGESNINDLYMMSLCNHNIISNSTFSWWGAWLNNNQNKKVIAPSLWFGDLLKHPTTDIIPKEWIKL